jgi:hypothetical protein
MSQSLFSDGYSSRSKKITNARTELASSRRGTKSNELYGDGAAQSVHSWATLKVPRSNPRRIRVSMPPTRLFLSTGKRWPRSGWKGWTISVHPKCLLWSSAVCSNRRDAERAHRFTVRFRDVDTSQGLRLVPPVVEFVNCPLFLLGCVPNFSVHTGGFLTSVFRHSSNSNNLAAIRVGQQAL